jgi:hypothetical protein
MTTIKEKKEEEEKEKEFKIPYTVLLKYPVTWGKSETVTEITFPRRLKVADFKGIPTSDLKFDHMVKVVARVTGKAETLLMEIDIEDFMQLSEVVNSFLPGGQKDGEI